MYTDQLLTDLLKKGDVQACGYFYEKYAGALYVLINQVLQHSEAAEQVLQQTFTDILQRIGEYDASKGRLFTWAMQVSREHALKKRQSSATGFQKSSYSSSFAGDDYGVGKLVTRLGDEEKELVHLSYFKGYSAEDVAKQLNIPAETARQRIRNALMRLNSLL